MHIQQVMRKLKFKKKTHQIQLLKFGVSLLTSMPENEFYHLSMSMSHSELTPVQYAHQTSTDRFIENS